MKKSFSFIFRFVATAGLFFVLIKFVPYKNILDLYHRSDKIYLLLSFILFLFPLLVVIPRWKFLLSFTGIRLSLFEVSLSVISSFFFNLFCPSFIAGDVFRGVDVCQRHGRTQQVVSSIFMDRFSGLFALMLIGIVSFIAGKHLFPQPQVFYCLVLFFLGMVFVSLIVFSKRFFFFLTVIFKKSPFWKNKLVDFHDQLYLFKKNPGVFLKAVVFSLPAQISAPLSFFAAAKAFGAETELIYFLILVPIITMITVIPLTIAGLGVREASSVYFFSLIGMDSSISVSISFLTSVFLLLEGIIGGIIYVGIYHRWIQVRLDRELGKS